jgi:hypothetical protein
MNRVFSPWIEAGDERLDRGRVVIGDASEIGIVGLIDLNEFRALPSNGEGC